MSHSYHKQNENSLGERLGFLSFRFPVSFLRFLFLFRFSVAFREFILVNLESLSLSFKSFFVGVSRFAENGLGLPPIEGFVSPVSVLH